jgi:hypothetical protein
MLKKLTLLLLFGLAAQANAASTTAELSRILASHDWKEGEAVCASLPEVEGHRANRGLLPPSHYAQLAALCAAVESGAGDDPAAEWWWFTATAMDGKTALELLPEFRSRGLLTRLSSPRKLAWSATAKAATPQVILPTGEAVDGEGVKVVEQPRAPHWMFHPVKTQVVIELLIGADGIPRQPLLVSVHSLPLHVFLAFAYLRQWRFSPAMVGGKPTPSAYQLSINTERER